MSLDMTMMYAVHDALRRDLERVARITAKTGDDPRRLLVAAAGWEQFKQFLVIHHTTEDATLWPVMEAKLAGRPDDLELLAAMEAEHAAIDPLLIAIDEALADRESGQERLGGLADALVTGLTGHLRHEESQTLALIDATLTEQEWSGFGQAHGGRIGPRAPQYLPWLLDGADGATQETILGRMPPHLREQYENEWRQAYAKLDLW